MTISTTITALLNDDIVKGILRESREKSSVLAIIPEKHRFHSTARALKLPTPRSRALKLRISEELSGKGDCPEWHSHYSNYLSSKELSPLASR